MKGLLFMLTVFVSMNLSAQTAKDKFEVGDKAPAISGVDQFGKKIKSKEILENHKILLVFYRGNWCPHCRKHLASLQEHLEEFTEKGVYVIVVTPETVEKAQETTRMLKAGFSIIHDVNNKIMNKYGVAFEVNKENVGGGYMGTLMKTSEYNAEGNNVLPVPATYLIDQNGTFSYVQFDPNYKKRADFKELMGKL